MSGVTRRSSGRKLPGCSNPVGGLLPGGDGPALPDSGALVRKALVPVILDPLTAPASTLVSVGTIPALRAPTRPELNDTLREEASGTTRRYAIYGPQTTS